MLHKSTPKNLIDKESKVRHNTATPADFFWQVYTAARGACPLQSARSQTVNVRVFFAFAAGLLPSITPSRRLRAPRYLR